MKIPTHIGNPERHLHVVFLYLISSPILIKLKLSCGSVYQGACFGFCQIEQRACVLNKQQHFVFLIWDPRNALTPASSYLKLKKQLNLWSVSIEKCFKEGTSIHSKTIIYIYIYICVACICTCMSEMLGLARSKQWSKDNDCLD